jgi:hypothetical protein
VGGWVGGWVARLLAGVVPWSGSSRGVVWCTRAWSGVKDDLAARVATNLGMEPGSKTHQVLGFAWLASGAAAARRGSGGALLPA